MNTKTRILTVDLHTHYICFVISVRYLIVFTMYNYKTQNRVS